MSDETIGGGGSIPGRPRWDLERYKLIADDQTAEVADDEDVPPPQFTRKSRPQNADYTADGVDLFWKVMRMSFYTILTVGIYRFWMLTAIRRHYWSGITIQEDPLEYTGRGIEKLLGFLLALVILALYLGLMNVALTFIGLSIAGDDPVFQNLALSISLLATLPLIFFAQYRGMRYLLSRTRWRGIRFGLGPGSWGYTRRAIGLSILTGITFGLAYPYQHFHLAKFMTDRSWFGDMKFKQEGSWWELFASWVWIYIAALFIGLAIWGLQLAGERSEFGLDVVIGLVIYFVALIVFYFTILRYRYAAFKVLWSNRKLGDDVIFDSDLNVSNVVNVYISGTILIAFVASLVLAMATALIALTGLINSEGLDLGALAEGSPEPGAIFEKLIAIAPTLAVLAFTYLFVFALISAMTQVFLTHRILLRKVKSIQISNPRALSMSQQRAHDEASEAGGFADALGVDIGAGF
ncbi:MAG: DUF898 family protein [Pseudomonadota bacterium]